MKNSNTNQLDSNYITVCLESAPIDQLETFSTQLITAIKKKIKKVVNATTTNSIVFSKEVLKDDPPHLYWTDGDGIPHEDKIIEVHKEGSEIVFIVENSIWKRVTLKESEGDFCYISPEWLILVYNNIIRSLNINPEKL